MSEKQFTSASICAVLTQLDIQEIVKTIDREYYSDKKWHYWFSFEAMLKLLVVMHFRKYSYEKTIFSLTESEIRDLCLVD